MRSEQHISIPSRDRLWELLDGDLDQVLLRLTVRLLVSNVREAVSAVALKYLTYAG